MNEPLIVIARARAKPGTAAELIAAQTRLVHATRQAPGCIRYDLHASTTEPDLVLFVEAWASEAHWQAHMRGVAIQEFRRTGGHLIGEFDLQTYRQVA